METVMRKSIIYLAAFAFLFAASCQKEMEIIQAEKTDNETPEEEVVICSQKLVPITFEVNAETKVAIDGEHVNWENGDQIEIYWGTQNGDHATATATVSAGKASFSGVVGEDGPYYAVYPKTAAAEFKNTEDVKTLEITIPASQTGGSFKEAVILTSYTTAVEKNFGEFKSAVSLVRFPISRNDVTRVEFVPYSGAASLGTVTVDADKNITPTPTAGVTSLTGITGAGTYYIAVAPGVEMNGVGFRVGTSSEWLGVVQKKVDFTLPRGKILGLSFNLDEHLYSGDWYITPEGAGKKDGSSWENAGDKALFFNLIGYSKDEPAKQAFAAWRTDGKTINLGAGTYTGFTETAGSRRSIYTNSLASLPTVTIKGGHDGDTIFDADLGGDQYTGFFKFNTNCFTKVTLDGITFRSGKSTNQGGAIWVGCPALIKDCTFEDCYEGTTGGGAIYADHAEVEIDGCTFTNCTTAKVGGAIYANKAIVIKGSSVFDGCSAGQNGGAIYPAVAGVSIEGSVQFTDCEAAQNGGAIYSEKDITVEGATFANCSSTEAGGAVAMKGGKLTITGCTFKGNDATTTGGAINLASSAALDVYACTFGGTDVGDGNSSATTGGAINNASNGAITIYGREQATDSTRFTANTAVRAAAIYNNQGTIAATDVAFRLNVASAAGSVLYQGGVANVSLTNCSIIRNVAQSIDPEKAAVNANMGGAIANIYINNANESAAGASTITASGCVFKGNTSAGRGGAVDMGKGTWSFDGCTFSQNVASGNGGGAIAVPRNTSSITPINLYITNSVFDANECTAASNNGSGAAMLLNNPNTKCFVYNSLFKNGKVAAKSGTKVTYTTSDAINANSVSSLGLYACTFVGNSGNYSTVQTNAQKAAIVNCTFMNRAAKNYTPNGGIIYNTGTDNTFVINNIVCTSSLYVLGGSGSIKTSGNIWANGQSNVKDKFCAFTDLGLGDEVYGKAATTVFGDGNPQPDENGKLVPLASFEMASIQASAIKPVIENNFADFYTWLNTNNYWFSGASWNPGAYQR